MVGGLLLALAVFSAPLPYGSVEPEAVLGLRLATALLLAVATCALVLPSRSGGRPRDGGRERLRPVAMPATALLGLALLGVLQAAPWPAAVVGWISPAHAEVWRESGEILAAVEGNGTGDPQAPQPDRDAAAAEPSVGGADTGEAGGRKAAAAPRFTLDPAASRSTALDFAGLAALLLAAALLGRARRTRRWLAVSIVAAGLFQVLYGLRSLRAGSTRVWGAEVLGVVDRLRGTYVNPNHVVYLLEIALAVAFAGAWWAWRQARREASLERRLLWLIPIALAGLGLLGGVVLTRSRAGLLAALVGITVQSALVATRGGRLRTASLGLAAALVGLGILAGAGLQGGFTRVFGTSLADVSWNARLEVSRLTLDLWSRFPVTGSGLGTFADAFKAVEPADLAGDAWLHAHNDYAELAATGGVLAVLLLALGGLALVMRLHRVLLHGRRSEDRAAALAAVGALAAVAVHEAFDFGLVLPANAFVLTALCGAAAGAGLWRRRGGRGSAAGEEDPAGEEVAAG